MRSRQVHAQQFNRIPDGHALSQTGLRSADIHMGDNAIGIGVGPIGNFSRAMINRSRNNTMLLQQFKPLDPGIVFATSGIVEKKRTRSNINSVSG